MITVEKYSGVVTRHQVGSSDGHANRVAVGGVSRQRTDVSVVEVIAATQQHIYQVLTKRPSRARRLAARGLVFPSNLWLGSSVENGAVTHRITDLLATPAAVRFLSCEPLLGPIDLDQWLFPNRCSGGCGCRWPDDGDRFECLGCGLDPESGDVQVSETASEIWAPDGPDRSKLSGSGDRKSTAASFWGDELEGGFDDAAAPGLGAAPETPRSVVLEPHLLCSVGQEVPVVDGLPLDAVPCCGFCGAVRWRSPPPAPGCRPDPAPCPLITGEIYCCPSVVLDQLGC
ncbi:DUF5131 family protein [Nocardia xishanensis]